MPSPNLIAALSLGISLALLCGLVLLFKDYRDDSLRDQLFALRDEMFLYAHDRGLLESPAHTKLRILMNSLIRYAHRVSFFRLLLWGMATRYFGVKIRESVSFKEWQGAVQNLSEADQKCFQQFHRDAGMLVLKHIITGSPVLWCAGTIVGMCLIINRTRTMLFDKTAEVISGHVFSIDLLEADAMGAVGSA